jgi:glycosyltransferase involved in cell wall biosynthesis
MSTRVLISPAGPSLDRSKYGKEYYLLENIAESDPDLQIEAYFKKISEIPPVANLAAHSIKEDTSRNRYYFDCFKKAREIINSGDVDIYHHLNFHYRFFNPLAISGLVDDVPYVVGPAEPPHTIPDHSKRTFIKEMTGVNWSDETLDRVLPVADWMRFKIYNRIREFLFRLTLEQADRIVVVNKETASMYAEYVPRSKIEVIPYGVVVDRFKTGSPDESTEILSIGSLYTRKGCDLLIEAWASVATEYPESTLNIIGKGPQRETLERRVEDLEIQDTVVFHGYVERDVLLDMLASSRAFVHPSRSEGFPHVRLEAMASGCPVIASNVTGTNEMIRDGKDGLVIPTDDVDRLTEAISTLLDSPEKAKEMGENARTHAKQNFDWEEIGKRFAEVYRDIL